ncbi:uncharacterized protein J7T54_002592 [Emericellopsis cladophorae]|uniref:Aromatic amino acid beta-eliminating lyase/threonine aldolase domain-containing protein n=1 Tax=Emericellopsis cladophorae TaxID=2686198 RepID=A0A9P9XWY6_9HYPO|nr:uncharacterized protein J7T54_002592 [Emericellopsis cladophorae]KAI6778950.1 hypothetical protein J7T54_002592 [Emericellopsis cladophorae]
MTTPTASMLKAIQECTLLDDVEREDPTTSDLEAHMAALTGKEAGLFVNSGIMGNQLALRTLLTQPPHGVLCDHRSHIVLYEAGGLSFLTGAMPTPLVPKNGIHLTLEDIKPQVVLGDDIHTCPTRVISLENTLNGMILPLDEARRISTFAREHGIKMHLDGARLWEAVASGAGTLKEYCAPFDTITMCFSKGLGAPVGSVLVGTTKDLHHARWMRRAIGGGLRQPGFISAAARVAVDEAFGTKGDGSDGWLRTAHDLAKKVEAMWLDKGGKLVHPAHTNMCWLDLDAAGIEVKQIVQAGEEAGLRLFGGRIVLHYQAAQHGEEILERLDRVFTKVLAEATGVSTLDRVGRANMYSAE